MVPQYMATTMGIRPSSRVKISSFTITSSPRADSTYRSPCRNTIWPKSVPSFPVVQLCRAHCVGNSTNRPVPAPDSSLDSPPRQNRNDRPRKLLDAASLLSLRSPLRFFFASLSLESARVCGCIICSAFCSFEADMSLMDWQQQRFH